MNDEEIKNYALVEIDKLLRMFGKSLSEFDCISFSAANTLQSSHNRLINDELQYNREILKKEHSDCLTKLTYEQRHVYDTIMNAVESNNGGMFFVYRYGGTGKTFIWKTLSAALRSKGEIVLNVASSGRTAHCCMVEV